MKFSVVIHLELIDFWCQPDLRWPPKRMELIKYIFFNNSINFTGAEVRFGEVVADNCRQHIHLSGSLTDLCLKQGGCHMSPLI